MIDLERAARLQQRARVLLVRAIVLDLVAGLLLSYAMMHAHAASAVWFAVFGMVAAIMAGATLYDCWQTRARLERMARASVSRYFRA